MFVAFYPALVLLVSLQGHCTSLCILMTRPVVRCLSIACGAAGLLPWFGSQRSVISSTTAPPPRFISQGKNEIKGQLDNSGGKKIQTPGLTIWMSLKGVGLKHAHHWPIPVYEHQSSVLILNKDTQNQLLDFILKSTTTCTPSMCQLYHNCCSFCAGTVGLLCKPCNEMHWRRLASSCLILLPCSLSLNKHG